MSKDELIRRIQTAVMLLPGNNYEFTQPIQMRFNELLAGVRGDIAVKVFGEEFEPMLRAANRIADILRGLEGSADVRVEQITGLPFIDIKVEKAEIARRGLSLAGVQDVIGAAIGGREAGVVFEGDRRFDVVVRLPEGMRADIEALRNLPVPLPRSSGRSARSLSDPAIRTATPRSNRATPRQLSQANRPDP